MKPPVIIGGIGGSGTRLATSICEKLGFDLGPAKDVSQFYDKLSLEHPLQLYTKKAIFESYNDEMKTAILDKLVGFKGRWAWKNGWNMFYLPLFEEMFSGFKYIHMIRDGRDLIKRQNQVFIQVVGPILFKEKPTGRFWSPDVVVSAWSTVNINVDKLAQRLLGDRYILIRLEDICRYRELEVKRLIDFLQVEPNNLTEIIDHIKPSKTLGHWKKMDQKEQQLITGSAKLGLDYFDYL